MGQGGGNDRTDARSRAHRLLLLHVRRDQYPRCDTVACQSATLSPLLPAPFDPSAITEGIIRSKCAIKSISFSICSSYSREYKSTEEEAQAFGDMFRACGPSLKHFDVWPHERAGCSCQIEGHVSPINSKSRVCADLPSVMTGNGSHSRECHVAQDACPEQSRGRGPGAARVGGGNGDFGRGGGVGRRGGGSGGGAPSLILPCRREVAAPLFFSCPRPPPAPPLASALTARVSTVPISHLTETPNLRPC